jgi:hypothetical protein
VLLMRKFKRSDRDVKIGTLKRIAAESAIPALRKFPAKRLREFLVGFANTQAGPRDWERFMRSYREFFPRPVVGAEKDFYFAELANAQLLLRDVWQERDGEKREWLIYMLRNYSARTLTADPMVVVGDTSYVRRTPPPTLPPRDALQQALIYLGRRPRSARVCGREDCDQEKYFLATQPNQRYCTDVCALEAQRKRKRGAWEDYGKDWRAKRKQGTKR